LGLDKIISILYGLKDLDPQVFQVFQATATYNGWNPLANDKI
jgi:predicted transcriptional regulator